MRDVLPRQVNSLAKLRGYFFAIQGHANTQIQSSLKSRHDEIKKIHGVGWRHDNGLRIASRLRQHGPSF